MSARGSVITSALILACVVAAREALFYSPPCRPPCHRLDALPETEHYATTMATTAYSPIQLTLKIAEPKAPLGTRYTLSYIASIRNDCDERLLLQTDFFRNDGYLAANYKFHEDFYFAVADPDGRPVEPLIPPGGQEPALYGINETIARDRFPGAVEDLFATKLDPGAEWISVPSVVHPTQESMASGWDKDGGWTGSVRRPIHVEGVPAPPQGYHVLDRYVFTRAGRYSIQLRFDEKVTAYPDYPIAERLPPGVVNFLRDWGMAPKLWGRQIEIHAASAPLAFEVMP